MRCAVCRELLSGQESLSCIGCGALHHYECWAYYGRCSRYACGCREGVPRSIPHLRVVGGTVRRDGQAVEKERRSLLSGDWEHGWEMNLPWSVKLVV